MTALPDFDDLKTELLRLLLTPFGAAGAVLVALYVLWRKLTSYVDAARTATAAGLAAYGWVARQLQQPGRESLYAMATTVVMLGAQVAWLGSTIIMGNLISLVFGPRSSTDGSDVHAPGDLLGELHWDAITQGYVLICAVSAIASYKFAKDVGVPGFLFFVCGLPGWFWGVFGAVGAAVATVAHFAGLHVDGLDTVGQLESIWTIVAIGLIFLGLTHAAFRAPAIIRHAW